MALLIKNITTYQKTKPIYDTYRKSKNKGQHCAAHEGSIILHEAAAKANSILRQDRELERDKEAVWG